MVEAVDTKKRDSSPPVPGRTVEEVVAALRPMLPVLAGRYFVSSLGVCGSFARGAPRADSDLDVVAGFTRSPGLLELAELEQWLSDHLGVKVDLIVRETLTGRIGERILSETVPV